MFALTTALLRKAFQSLNKCEALEIDSDIGENFIVENEIESIEFANDIAKCKQKAKINNHSPILVENFKKTCDQTEEVEFLEDLCTIASFFKETIDR